MKVKGEIKTTNYGIVMGNGVAMKRGVYGSCDSPTRDNYKG